MELAAKGQLGTYGNLNGGSNVGDKLDAHELVRHEALVQAGCTYKFSNTIPLEGSGLNVSTENTESESDTKNNDIPVVDSKSKGAVIKGDGDDCGD